MARNARLWPWSQSEDRLLLNIISEQGIKSWKLVSQILSTRSPKQCRERFHNILNPSLNHARITPSEGGLIEHLVSEMGKKWAKIARQLNGRSPNTVKNWWYGTHYTRKRRSRRKHARPEATLEQKQQAYYLDHSQLGNQNQSPRCQIQQQQHWNQRHYIPALPSVRAHLNTTGPDDSPVSSYSCGRSVLSTENALPLFSDRGLQSWPFRRQGPPIETPRSSLPSTHSRRCCPTSADSLDGFAFLADDSVSRRTSLISVVETLPQKGSHCLIQKSLPSFSELVRPIGQRIIAKPEPTPPLPPIRLNSLAGRQNTVPSNLG